MAALFLLPIFVVFVLAPLCLLVLGIEAFRSEPGSPKLRDAGRYPDAAPVQLRLPCLRVRTAEGKLKSCLLEARVTADGIVCPMDVSPVPPGQQGPTVQGALGTAQK